MRGKRAKQYKKLMKQYEITYGFREPYQVLIDAEMVKETDRFKMDLVEGLKRTLHGEVKPMITQCCMRHLYALSATGDKSASFIIDKAKLFERRRCGHLPADYPEPLSAVDCIASVIDPKGTGRNKNRYIIASTDEDVREKVEEIIGTPLIFVNKSVMIMARMPEASQVERVREERHKFRDQLKKIGGSKRKRDEEDENNKDGGEGTEEQVKKKKKVYGSGPKQPNPLSVKKSKKKAERDDPKPLKDEKEVKGSSKDVEKEADDAEQGAKRKRIRKRKSVAKADEGVAETDAAELED